ncbi:MAG: hypothetical protein U0842_25495 [Candidatus Binatia bacterium]
MEDDRRRETNQRNAKKSTGPRTASGKARSSRNATRHGLLSQRMLLDGESEREFKALRQGMRQSLRPVGEFEEELVERMVTATWRKRRGDRVELGLWDWRGTVSEGKTTLANVFFVDSQHDQSLQKLTRYMSAYSGEFRRAYKMLGEAQSVRQEQADAGEWVDVEADGGGTKEDGLEAILEDHEDGPDDDPGDDGPDDDPDDGDAGGGTEGGPDGPASPSVTQAQAQKFASGPDWWTRGRCSAPRIEVESRASTDASSRDASDVRREDDLSAAEQALLVIRTAPKVLEVGQIIDEVLFDQQWVERMPVSDLIRVKSRFDSMIWQTTLGIDKLIKQLDAEGH